MSSGVANLTNKTGPLLAFCFISLLIASVIGELSQTTNKNSNQSLLTKNPISKDILENIKVISINNSLGDFTVEKKDGLWWIRKDRPLYANPNISEKLMESLRNIKVEKVLENDALNRNYFSLNNPIFSVTLNDLLKLEFGLINSIDNSTYFTFTGSKNIYQAKVLDFDIQTLNLNDIFYRQLFRAKPNEIVYLELITNRTSRLKLNYVNNQWLDQNKRVLNEKKVNSFLIDIFTRNADVVIDQNKDEVYSKVDRYIKNAPFELRFKNKSDRSFSYKFTNPVKELTPLEIEKRKYLLMKGNDDYYPILVDKDFVNIFSKRSRNFRE